MRKPCCKKKETSYYKGAWTKQEDQKLIDYIQKHGEGCWRSLPQAAGLVRSGKSCRLRWVNYLRPDLKRGNIDQDEEDLIIKLHALLGNRWSLIAGRLPGRTDNEVKNYWNTHLKRKLMQMGVDPKNHHLRQPGTNLSLVPKNQKIASGTQDWTGLECNNNFANSNEVNSTTSCSEGNTVSSLPDLNLDLNIGLPLVEETQC
ncbi:hypothetical protein LWI28_024169 [Acer negundo]|uniref:Uncharacterized protein n=1 Tax=Acer negundo TaxID=4023 RepID=A0AAD5NQT9_ACENE|nr:hypothetical protein LWI28_024169 [Acer negundo]KAK4844459.1 hypothetical protein QYF36_020388 [Acer negundo]